MDGLLRYPTASHHGLVLCLAECVAAPYTTVSGDTTGAPKPATNPETCPDEEQRTICINGCRSLWYRAVGTGRAMSASTCPGGPGRLDSRLVVYEGSCARLTCLGNNDDACAFGGSSLRWSSKAGAVYHIQVTGIRDMEPGVEIVGPFALRVDGTNATLVETPST
jgi:hypothetical protein